MDLMELQNIIESYGYAAILIGTFLEGETILVPAGLAAHQGYLVLTGVILAAFLGSLCGDQLFLFGSQTQSGGFIQAARLEGESGTFFTFGTGKNKKQDDGANNAADNIWQPDHLGGQPRKLIEKTQHDISPGGKTGNHDGCLLKEDRNDRAQPAGGDGQNHDQDRRRIAPYLLGVIVTTGKTDAGQEQPEKAATCKYQDDSNQNVDPDHGIFLLRLRCFHDGCLTSVILHLLNLSGFQVQMLSKPANFRFVVPI